MTAHPDPGRPEFAVLWRQARTAVARGQVKLGYKAPDPAAASAVGAVIGRELTAGIGTTIVVAELDARVRAVFSCGLGELLSSLFGERAGEVVAPAEADDVLGAAVSAHGISGGWVRAWVDQARRYAKISAAELAEVAPKAAAAIARLHLGEGAPTEWIVLSDLGVVRGTRLAGLVLRAAAVAHGVAVPKAAADERRLWERSGVLLDAVSTTVLTWAFPGCEARTELGLPTHLTIRDTIPSGVNAVVCTSPAVVDNCITAGVRHPVICLSGHLNPVARTILSKLHTPRIHSDFDAHGLFIAQQALTLTNGTPWRMSANDYRAALTAGHDLPALGPDPLIAPWDPALPEAMRAGWSVPEHLLAADLVAELLTF
ncbi:uncharacterized protein (TIGR02679 family) [Actinokineospora baliensis]|uniref:DUF2399 domain-containing protein n=1 Tax=Actinokineospora baliensis TaxID=547056 RepID=UPI001959E0A4|nr:DUF2399 domain-containing protein [Actinokineospora baliensis]MBM7772141.1 uncharacterized protein (TIGR02679 family) [Actinokineospora baliensis]